MPREQTKPTANEALITRYRPRDINEVFGQHVAVNALYSVIEHNDAQQFLFSGMHGVGKTTLARITCGELGVQDQDIMSIDAATNSGIDAMRAVAELTHYVPFGGDRRAVIIDEAHGLSKQAWDSLLMATEEPPPYMFWFLCTTNISKIPKTIQSRFATFHLQPLTEHELGRLVVSVCTIEKIKLAGGVLDLIVREAQGSARQALGNLALCRDLKDHKQAAAVLHTALETDATLELCRLIVKGGSWQMAMKLFEQLDTSGYEGVRIIVTNYLGACLKRSKSEAEACRFLSLLEHWREPFNAAENAAPLLMAIGRSLFERS